MKIFYSSWHFEGNDASTGLCWTMTERDRTGVHCKDTSGELGAGVGMTVLDYKYCGYLDEPWNNRNKIYIILWKK